MDGLIIKKLSVVPGVAMVHQEVISLVQPLYGYRRGLVHGGHTLVHPLHGAGATPGALAAPSTLVYTMVHQLHQMQESLVFPPPR